MLWAVSFADTHYDLNTVEVVEAKDCFEAISKHSLSCMSVEVMKEKGMLDYRRVITYYKDNHLTLVGMTVI